MRISRRATATLDAAMICTLVSWLGMHVRAPIREPGFRCADLSGADFSAHPLWQLRCPCIAVRPALVQGRRALAKDFTRIGFPIKIALAWRRSQASVSAGSRARAGAQDASTL